MSSLPRVFIRARAARPFFARHPWVFANSVEKVTGDPAPGAEVDVVTHDNIFIAKGLYNPHSGIRVRLYRWDQGPIDDAFLADRLTSAIRFRERALRLGGEHAAYRAVFSESDGLSGLTIDRFDRWLVVQFSGLGLHQRRETIFKTLGEIYPDLRGILVKGDRSTAEAEGLSVEEAVVTGSPPELEATIVENGVRYALDMTSGQKTGFYLDQRDNRRAVASYAAGRRVLDLYCYTGGFSLNAVRNGGATSTLGIDSSGPAIALARRNAVLNGAGNARFEEDDVADALDRLTKSGEKFGLVICDPPKFVRNPKNLEKGLKAYLRLNRAALDVLEPDGILATCSCSAAVDRELFAQMLAQVSGQSGRSIQILDARGQAADHPVAAACLETDYLKCFLCRVV